MVGLRPLPVGLSGHLSNGRHPVALLCDVVAFGAGGVDDRVAVLPPRQQGAGHEVEGVNEQALTLRREREEVDRELQARGVHVLDAGFQASVLDGLSDWKPSSRWSAAWPLRGARARLGFRRRRPSFRLAGRASDTALLAAGLAAQGGDEALPLPLPVQGR